MNSDPKCRFMNNRPLFVLALCFAFGIVLGRFLEYSVLYIAAAAVLMIAAFCYGVPTERSSLGCSYGVPTERSSLGCGLRKKALFMLLGAAFSFFGLFLCSSAVDMDYIKVDEDMKIEGKVVEAPYVSAYGDIIIALDKASIDGRKSGGIKLYIDSETLPDFKPGDIIKAEASVQIPKGVKNPGGYNERLQLLTKGIYYKAYTDSAVKTGEKGGLLVWSAAARSYIGSVIDDIFEDDVSGVAKAMLLGEKSGIDEEVYSDFRDTGMAHVLAVSGLHAAILIAFFYFLMRWLKIGRTAKLIVTLVFIAVYTCVTGLTPSIVRASIMASSVLLGAYFGRQSDSLNYLSLAFIITLIINPLDIFSTSFMLSFGAVFGIVTLGWQVDYGLKKILPRSLNKLGGMISMSVGASAGTASFLALKFNRISTFSILTNILIIPFASAAIVLVFVSTVAGMIYSTLGGWLAYVSGFFLRILISVIKAIAGISFTAVDVASPPWYLILACYLILFISSKFVLIKTWLKTVLITAVTVAAAAVLLFSVPGGMYVVFLDVGQADAAFIRTEQGGEYFIDGGREQSNDEIVGFTIRNGYTPDAAFVSHSDDDHFSGIKALYEKGLLKKVYCSYQEQDYIQQQLPQAEVVPLCSGDVVWLDEKTAARVLYPYKDTVTDEKNDASLVIMVEYQDIKVLFTGDISGLTETMIFAEIGEVDIYKAAHHGSQHSSFKLPLGRLRPRYSVVSAGYNTFGHPHEYAMENLEEYSGQVYTTIDECAVEFYIDSGIKVRTFGDADE